MSWLLINDLFDHKVIFTFYKNNSYLFKGKQILEVETRDDL